MTLNNVRDRNTKNSAFGWEPIGNGRAWGALKRVARRAFSGSQAAAPSMLPRALALLAKEPLPENGNVVKGDTGEGRPDHHHAEYLDIAVRFETFERSLAGREVLHGQGK